jgi:predicted transcriptional regulator
MSKEKKLLNPISAKVLPSTKAAIDKACHKQNRSISYIVEEALREHLKLNVNEK